MLILYAHFFVIIAAFLAYSVRYRRIFLIEWKQAFWVILVSLGSAIAGILFFPFLETGHFGGKSFLGCVFFCTIALAILAPRIHVQRSVLGDYCVPFCALFLFLIKFRCWYLGCCSGRLIFHYRGNPVYFPSQIVEGLNGLLMFFVLKKLWKNERNRGCVAPAFFLLFGVTRFVLNFFRKVLIPVSFLKEIGIWIPPGHLWSAIMIVVGAVWLYFARSRIAARRLNIKEFLMVCIWPDKCCAAREDDD